MLVQMLWGDCARGKIIYADGSKYDGELKDGKSNGKGRYTSGGINSLQIG